MYHPIKYKPNSAYGLENIKFLETLMQNFDIDVNYTNVCTRTNKPSNGRTETQKLGITWIFNIDAT